MISASSYPVPGQGRRNVIDLRARRSSRGGSVAWPGLVVIAGKRFYDADLRDDVSGSDIAITDNSTGGAKTWIKCVVTPLAEAVTYEDAPVFISGAYPPDTEYYERALQTVPIHIPRFG